MRMNSIGAACLLTAALLAPAPAPAAAWSDRAEYDLVLVIRTEASPQKRIKLLDEWKLKYPKSELRQVRRELYLSAFQSTGDSARMLSVAQEMLADAPDNFVGLYWCTLLTTAGKDTSPDALKASEESARRLLKGLDGFLAAGMKPAALPEAQWGQERGNLELMAHRALGWIEWQRSNFTGAEAEFAECLKLQPASGETSAWMGTVLSLQNQPGKQIQGFWHLARAASLRDQGAMPESQRRQIASLLERLYTAYHGDTEGLEKLQSAALAAVHPPAGFHVESAIAIAERKAEIELERTNPELAAWKKLRKRLELPDGEEYFGLSVKNTPIPKMKGLLVRATPAGKPNELGISIGTPGVEEIVLKLKAPFANEAEPGTPLTFGGVAESLTRSPFSLVVTADDGTIEGWPAPPPTPKRR